MTENDDLKTYGVFASPGSEKLIGRLRSEKCNLIIFPESEISSAETNAAEKRISSEIDNFDWLIFFEPDGVDLFLAALNGDGVDLFELDNLRICALGELTADRLRFEQIHTDIIFTLNDKNLSDLIGQYVSGESGLKTQKVLIIRESGAHSEIERQLTESSMVCTTLELFESEIKENPNAAKLEALLRGGAIDEMILTSPHDLISLKKICRLTEIDFQISATNENLVQFLRDNGLNAKLYR